jgi:hypothetical protein
MRQRIGTDRDVMAPGARPQKGRSRSARGAKFGRVAGGKKALISTGAMLRRDHVAVMLHLRSLYVSKAAILTISAFSMPVENRSPA